jgi:hypothetical protein
MNNQSNPKQKISPSEPNPQPADLKSQPTLQSLQADILELKGIMARMQKELERVSGVAHIAEERSHNVPS